VEDIGSLQLLPKDSENDDNEDLGNLPEDEQERIQILREKGAVRFDELFNMIAVLGVGGFGVVVACRNKHNNRKYALKIV
jgi:serine/threonine protein kinase